MWGGGRRRKRNVSATADFAPVHDLPSSKSLRRSPRIHPPSAEERAPPTPHPASDELDLENGKTPHASGSESQEEPGLKEYARQSTPEIDEPAAQNAENEEGATLNDEGELGFFTAHSSEATKYFNKKMIVHSTTLFNITGPKGVMLKDYLPAFRRQVEQIYAEATKQALPHEHLQLIAGCKQAPDKYISTRFFRKQDPEGVARLFALIQASCNSGATWRVDDDIEITVKHVKNSTNLKVGTGKRFVVTDLPSSILNRRSFITMRKNLDNSCMARAIAVIMWHKKLDKARCDPSVTPAELQQLKTHVKKVKRCQSKTQTEEAQKLCQAIGIGMTKKCGFEEAKQFENLLGVYIKIFATDQYNKFVYDGVQSNFRELIPVKDENVYFMCQFRPEGDSEQHVVPVVSIKGALDTPFFCLVCNKKYQRIKDHRCRDVQGWCFSCFDRDCQTPDPDFTKAYCPICNITFRSAKCQNIHETKSLCKNSYHCGDCRRDIPRLTIKVGGRLTDTQPTERIETDKEAWARHVCKKKCHLCKEEVDDAFHKCFIQKEPYKTPSEKLLFFDFETDQSSKKHEPIFCHIMWYQPATQTWDEQHFWVKDSQQLGAKNISVKDRVGKFLFSKQFQGYTMIAHNMKAFDGCFLLRYMGENGMKARPIFSGRKIMSLTFQPLHIRIIDSVNFLPMPLAAFQKSFDLKNCGKGHFPHFFASPSNYLYKGDLPPMKAYGYNGMRTEAREDFIQWYNEVANSDQPVKFDFERDINIYCRQDVHVLKEGCMAFKNLLMQLTEQKCDPFQYTTLASVSSAIFKATYLKPETIAAVPPNGYGSIQRFSSISIEWLEWLRQKQGITNLKHVANSAIGEATFTSFRVDGVDQENQTIYEFYGCYYHGCPTCFPDRYQLNKTMGKTFSAIHSDTVDRQCILVLSGWDVETMWECAWKKKKNDDPDIQEFVHANKDLFQTMSPFDSFFGGRVEPFKMIVANKKLSYDDVTSLYPFINATMEYPVGHPEVILNNFGDTQTVCDRYFGFMKCVILPPQKLYLPVLPGKFGKDKKLIFALCRTCAEERTPEKACTHNDQERALTGTWFIAEIKKAVEKGYKIQTVLGIYHFQETTTELFADYIRLFYKLKLVSSGIPPQCKTDEDLEAFIDQVQQWEKITITKQDFDKNPGMRQLSKLFINSLWGKFGLRRNLPAHHFCTTIEEISTLLHDESIEVNDILPLHENLAIVTTAKKSQEHYEINNHANIYIASTTTAWARLELYQHMEKLGTRMVYCDTDSIIYEVDEDNPENNPERGPFLGQLTNELKNHDDHISDFISGGPKNYGYKTIKGEECIKVKGFSLNYVNKQAFTFNNMREVIANFLDIDPDSNNPHQASKVTEVKNRTKKNAMKRDEIREEFHNANPDSASSIATPSAISVFSPNTIARSATWELLSVAQQKMYTVNFDKRVVLGNYDTFPYGFKWDEAT